MVEGYYFYYICSYRVLVGYHCEKMVDIILAFVVLVGYSFRQGRGGYCFQGNEFCDSLSFRRRHI